MNLIWEQFFFQVAVTDDGAKSGMPEHPKILIRDVWTPQDFNLFQITLIICFEFNNNQDSTISLTILGKLILAHNIRNNRY